MKVPWCVFKEKLTTVSDEAGMDAHEMKIAIVETLWTRNGYFDRSGFSQGLLLGVPAFYVLASA